MKRAILAAVFVTVILTLGPANALAEEGASRWNNFTLAPKLGWVYFGELKGDLGGDDRQGMNLMVNFDFGGTGSGFDLAFVYNLEDPGADTYWHSVGLALGYSYRMHFGDWYPYVGIGTRLGYLLGDGIKYAMEIYPRIPLGVTWYFMEDLGAILELGIGYGLTAMAYEAAPGLDDSFNIGHGLLVDLSVGIRWP